MIATFHNHSKWSDGKPEFRDIYAHASKIGVDILGLSDHFCIYPDGTSADWALKPDQTSNYLNDVISFQSAGKIEVRVGLEFDWWITESVPFITLSRNSSIWTLHTGLQSQMKRETKFT